MVKHDDIDDPEMCEGLPTPSPMPSPFPAALKTSQKLGWGQIMSSQTHFHSAPQTNNWWGRLSSLLRGSAEMIVAQLRECLCGWKLHQKVWMAVEELCGSRLNGFPSPTETAVDITHTNIIHRHLHHLEPLQPTPPHPHSSTVLCFIWERTSHKNCHFTKDGYTKCPLFIFQHLTPSLRQNVDICFNLQY